MSDEIAIKVEHVSKSFKLPHEKSGSIKGAILGLRKRKRGFEMQHVLKDVSFEIKKGEFFGIVGRNGSGKSTLLKLISQIYTPDEGSITAYGKLTPFIELGVGFNPELSGRDNVYLNGALLGFGRNEVNAMYDEIVEFAELERFMDQKLKNYSSGMQVRLAFSIAIRANTDILILDEVLAVGDEAFQRKCYEYFSQLKNEQKTVILVTHSMDNVERFCHRALSLHEGKIEKIGKPHEIASLYMQHNAAIVEGRDDKPEEGRWGSGGIRVDKVSIFADGKRTKRISVGEKLRLVIDLERDQEHIEAPIVCGLAFYNQEGVNMAGPNSFGSVTAKGAKQLVFETSQGLDFAPGKYSLTTAIYDESGMVAYDFLDQYYTFDVISDGKVHGATVLEGNWSSN